MKRVGVHARSRGPTHMWRVGVLVTLLLPKREVPGLIHVVVNVCVCVCVYRERDLCHCRRIRVRTLPTHIQPFDIRIQDPLRWSWYIYIISSIYKPKIKCFEYFLSIHQVAQNGQLKVVSLLDLCLGIQILYPTHLIMI